MAQWTRQPEEQPGEYFFSGRGVMTQGVAHSLAPEEIAWIVADLKRAVTQHQGLDHLHGLMVPFFKRLRRKLFYIPFGNICK